MNLEEKKEYLKRYIPKITAVRDLELEIQRIRLDKMYPSAVPGVCEPAQHSRKDLSDYIVALEEVYEELMRVRYEKIKCYTEIFRNIEAMADETEKRLLRLRYIKGLTWERVGEEMNYSTKQIHRLHGKALEHFTVT